MKTYQKVIISIIMIALCAFVYISKHQTPKTIVLPPVQTTISDTNEFYTIEAHIPIEPRDKDTIMSKTMTDIVHAKQEEWKIGGALYNEEKAIAKQYPDRPVMKYELGINYEKFTSNTKNTVTYVFKNYEFTGGAHGGTGLKTYTFDTNGLVDVGQVLNAGKEIELTRFMKEKLKESLGEMYNEQMLNEGLGLDHLNTDNSRKKADPEAAGYAYLSNFENFVLMDDGIKFIFSQYQIAPYAAGMPEIFLTWEELKNYLK